MLWTHVHPLHTGYISYCPLRKISCPKLDFPLMYLYSSLSNKCMCISISICMCIFLLNLDFTNNKYLFRWFGPLPIVWAAQSTRATIWTSGDLFGGELFTWYATMPQSELLSFIFAYFYLLCMFWSSHRTAYSFFCSMTSFCAFFCGLLLCSSFPSERTEMYDFGIQGGKGINLMCVEQNKKLVFFYCCYLFSFLPSLCWLHFTLNSLFLHCLYISVVN